MVEQDHFSTQCWLAVQGPLAAATKTHPRLCCELWWRKAGQGAGSGPPELGIPPALLLFSAAVPALGWHKYRGLLRKEVVKVFRRNARHKGTSVNYI